MLLNRQSIGLVIFATILAVASTSAGDEWTDFHIVIDPSSPTNEETFDLRAFRWFGDSGYVRLDQSIQVTGNQIDVRTLIQDQHTQPDSFFLTVMTQGGAFFNDFGPLATGTYQVNAEIWITPWPRTSGGYLFAEGSREFTVTGLGQNAVFSGDFNGDEVVDASDYVAWRKTGGAIEDYGTWQENFGDAVGGGLAMSVAVPEPATILLLLVARGFVSRRLMFCA
jgi:hypothetical protein